MPYNTAMKNLYWSHELTITSLERNVLKEMSVKSSEICLFLIQKKKKKRQLTINILPFMEHPQRIPKPTSDQNLFIILNHLTQKSQAIQPLWRYYVLKNQGICLGEITRFFPDMGFSQKARGSIDKPSTLHRD